jgi:hypothetical protein
MMGTARAQVGTSGVTGRTVSRLLRTVLAVVACVLAALGVGVALPALLIGNGLGQYEGEDRAYAEFVLIYDQELREWPFPVDPTVARRAQEVQERVPPSPEGKECTYQGGGPYGSVAFSGDYSAEVVHYGPFFVPTGKNVFRCDLARTISYPEVDPDGPFWDAYAYALLAWGLLVLVGVPAVLAALLLGGAWLLLRKDGELADRVVGSVAFVQGVLLVLAGGVHFLA